MDLIGQRMAAGYLQSPALMESTTTVPSTGDQQPCGVLRPRSHTVWGWIQGRRGVVPVGPLCVHFNPTWTYWIPYSIRLSGGHEPRILTLGFEQLSTGSRAKCCVAW